MMDWLFQARGRDDVPPRGAVDGPVSLADVALSIIRMVVGDGE
jgi:hypothetical protein